MRSMSSGRSLLPPTYGRVGFYVHVVRSVGQDTDATVGCNLIEFDFFALPEREIGNQLIFSFVPMISYPCSPTNLIDYENLPKDHRGINLHFDHRFHPTKRSSRVPAWVPQSESVIRPPLAADKTMQIAENASHVEFQDLLSIGTSLRRIRSGQATFLSVCAKFFGQRRISEGELCAIVNTAGSVCRAD
jgi:hypothetical protein